MIHLKCVLAGDPNCGKDILLQTYMTSDFLQSFRIDSTFVAATYDVDFILNDRNKFRFRLYDYDIEKSNQEQALTQNELDHIDLLILCYNKSDYSTKKYLIDNFNERIKIKWPNVTTILTSCSFLTNNSNSTEILTNGSVDQDLINLIKPAQTFYCSALSDFNMDQIFIQSFKQVVIDQNLFNFEKQKEHETIEILIKEEQISELIEKHEIKNSVESKQTSHKKIRTQSQKKKPNVSKNIFCEVDFDEKKLDFHLINHKRITLVNEKIGQYTPRKEKQSLVMIKRFSFSNATNSYKTLFALFSLACFLFYYFSKKYCSINREKCDELYDASVGLSDDSMSLFNRTYVEFVQRLKH
jgi:hypothetical protein